MPLSPALALWLDERGHDVVHATPVGLSRAADPEILEFARRDSRVILTADLDFPRMLAHAQAHGPGLVLFRGGNYSEREARERLARVLDLVPDDELPRSIVVVDRNRIRKRALPIDTGA